MESEPRMTAGEREQVIKANRAKYAVHYSEVEQAVSEKLPDGRGGRDTARGLAW